MPVYSNKDYIKITRNLPNFVERDIYDIPFIEANEVNISRINNGKFLINLKNCSTKDRNAKNKIVHGFCYDRTLQSYFNNPYRFLKKVAPYSVVSTMDFSIDPSMDFEQILRATYDNRWIGAFLQAYCKKVIPIVGWVSEKYYDITFAGLRDGGVFLISTLGVNNVMCYDDFISGYYEMRRRFPNTKIICVGKRLDGMDDDICYVKYKESFGSFDFKHVQYQQKLFNWDNTLACGGDEYVF